MFNKLLYKIESYFRKDTFYAQLHEILGYRPSKYFLYKLALTHRSASMVGVDGEYLNNERLEFLGDAILDAVVSDYLYKQLPNADEGVLTQIRARLVNGQKLGELATQSRLDSLLTLNGKSSIHANKHVHADAFEAFIGAIYLDKGYRCVFKFIVERIIEKQVDLMQLYFVDTNFKSQVIEWGQKYKREIRFETIQDIEKEHIFVAQIYMTDKLVGEGQGTSKKEAEQCAAELAIKNLEKIDAS